MISAFMVDEKDFLRTNLTVDKLFLSDREILNSIMLEINDEAIE